MRRKKRNYMILKNEKGIALLMVLSSITILTYLLLDLTFETKLNKIKTQNQFDQLQARLTSEAGLNFSLAKLRIYQEGQNYLEKNKKLKDIVSPSLLENMVTQPFFYPIPTPKGADIIQRTAIEDFIKNVSISGELHVSINSITGFINPNNLRIKNKSKSESANKNEQDNLKDEYGNREENFEDNDDDGENGSGKTVSEFTYGQLVRLLTNSLEQKKTEDEEFEALYGNLEPELLVKELRYYVSNETEMEEADKAEVDSNFMEKDLIPKHAPMVSLDELYLLPSWPDSIVDLVKSKLSVHEVSIIHVNEIGRELLRIIFPGMNDDQLTEFFRYRDGVPEENLPPNKFKNEIDFKNYIVGNLRAIGDSGYQNRIKELSDSGLVIGTSGKLFKAESIGRFGRASYKITAYIDLPIKPIPKKKKKDETKAPNPSNPEEEPPPPPEKKDDKKDKIPPRELLFPRVVEITIG
jgi:hypothetical protein